MAMQLDLRQLFVPETIVSLSGTFSERLNVAVLKHQNGKLGKALPLVPLIDKRMDAGFARAGAIKLASTVPVTPANHRIMLPGHLFLEALSIALQIGREQNARAREILISWLCSYLQDFCSPSGMPIGGWSRPCYLLLRKAGVRDANARKVVTLNAQRSISGLLQGGLTVLSLAHGFGTARSIPVSRGIGNHLASSLVLKSPAVGLVTLGGLAKAHRVGQLDGDALVKGALSSLIASGTNFAVQRSGVIGLVPGLLALNFANRYLACDLPLLDQARGAGRKAQYTFAIGRAFWNGFWGHLRNTQSGGQ